MKKDYIKGLMEGDVEAFRILFDRFYSPVVRFATAMLHDAVFAEDVVQEVFYDVYMHRDRIREDTPISGYMFTICRNKIADIFRREGSRMKYQELSEEAYEVPYESLIDAADLEVIVRGCVDAMPEQRRRVWRMSKEENRTSAEIAGILSISRRTVEKHIELAMKEIRKCIREYLNFFVFFV